MAVVFRITMMAREAVQPRAIGSGYRVEELRRALDMVELGALEKRRPAQLFGAQQQRTGSQGMLDEIDRVGTLPTFDQDQEGEVGPLRTFEHGRRTRASVPRHPAGRGAGCGSGSPRWSRPASRRVGKCQTASRSAPSDDGTGSVGTASVAGGEATPTIDGAVRGTAA